MKRIVYLALLIVICWNGLASNIAAQATAPAESQQVVYLHTEFFRNAPAGSKAWSSMLSRELVRQAVEIALRDELNVSVRDGSLRETPPDTGSVVHLGVITRPTFAGKWIVKLYTFKEKDKEHHTINLRRRKPVWEKAYDFRMSASTLYQQALPIFEKALREDFTEALKEAGIKPAARANQANPELALDRWDQELDSVDMVEQFATLKQVHQAIRTSGSSDELLGLLARGYANLSVLSHHQFNAASDVFAARGLLYAQRLVARRKEDEFSLWHRAYVTALVGLNHIAIADIEKVEKKSAPADALDSESAQSFDRAAAQWTNFVEPFARCDRTKILARADKNERYKKWALRLWFELVSERGYEVEMTKAFNSTFRKIPSAYGVYGKYSRLRALQPLRVGARLAPRALAEFLPAHVSNRQSSLGLPEDFFTDVDKLDSNQSSSQTPFSPLPQALANRLRKHALQEVDDLSSSALAYLIEEEQFAQAAHYCAMLTIGTESDHNEEIDSIMPLLGSHRYRAYIESFRYLANQNQDKFNRALENIVIEDASGPMARMMLNIRGVVDSKGKPIGELALRKVRYNFTVKGIAGFLYPFNHQIYHLDRRLGASLGDDCRVISPHSPIGWRSKFFNSDEADYDQLKGWEQYVNGDIACYEGLGDQYFRLKKSSDAIRCYEQIMAIDPTSNHGLYLARLHFSAKDLDAWERVLRDLAKSTKGSLTGANANSALAVGLMNRGLWRDAEAPALLGAEAWSVTGLTTASCATEGLAKWKESEQWIRECTVHYPTSSGHRWYMWCRRTGRGNLKQAQRYAKPFFERSTQGYGRGNWLVLGGYHLLERENQKALKAFVKALEFRRSLSCSVMIAQLYSELGDDQARDRYISQWEADAEDVPIERLGQTLMDLIKSDGETDDLLERVDKQLTEVLPGDTRVVCYCVGRVLLAKGKPELAAIYFDRSLKARFRGDLFATLSGFELGQLNRGPSRLDDDQWKVEDMWPPIKTDEVDDEKK